MDSCIHYLFQCWLTIRKQIYKGNQYLQPDGSIVIKYKNIELLKKSHQIMPSVLNLNGAWSKTVLELLIYIHNRRVG